jgi:hypothetical protein
MWSGEYRVMSSSFAPDAAALAEAGFIPASGMVRALPGAYAYHPNATIAAYGDVIRELRGYAGAPCSALRPVHGPPATRLAQLADALAPNAAGRLMVRESAARLLYFELRRCESDAGLAALQAMVALRAYQAEHGNLPDTLEVLVPRYLDALPVDAYDGRPLRYDAGRRRLRSVGSRLSVPVPDALRDDESFRRPEFDFPF